MLYTLNIYNLNLIKGNGYTNINLAEDLGDVYSEECKVLLR